jgi:hypothetical protein
MNFLGENIGKFSNFQIASNNLIVIHSIKGFVCIMLLEQTTADQMCH